MVRVLSSNFNLIGSLDSTTTFVPNTMPNRQDRVHEGGEKETEEKQRCEYTNRVHGWWWS